MTTSSTTNKITALSVILLSLQVGPAQAAPACYATDHTDCIAEIRGEQNLTERSRRLRQHAEELLSRSNQDQARETLIAATEDAEQIEEGYIRANTLRYIAEEYYRAGWVEDARTTMHHAQQAAAKTSPIARKLSAYIGLVETQGKMGDPDGARQTALHAFRHHVLEERAATNKVGETNRFLTNLDHTLYPMDALELLSILQHIPKSFYRRRVLYKLNQLSYRQNHATTPDPETYIEAWPDDANDKEWVMLYCLIAQLSNDTHLQSDYFNRAHDHASTASLQEFIETEKEKLSQNSTP